MLKLSHLGLPRLRGFSLPAVLCFFAMTGPASAQEGISSGDTAWILTATALVLFMTLPGLALFYGGLVRAQNLLSVLMQMLRDRLCSLYRLDRSGLLHRFWRWRQRECILGRP